MGQIKSKPHRKDSIEAKHCVPLGLYPTCSWPAKTLKKLVCDKKLSPMFQGVEEDTPGGKIELDECPICFYFYPHGLNRARCCRQEICTECFLQVKGNPSNIVSCPFCNKDEFSVVYLGPKSRAERKSEMDDQQKVDDAMKRIREEEIEADRKREEEKKGNVEETIPPPPPPSSSLQESKAEAHRDLEGYESETTESSMEELLMPVPLALPVEAPPINFADMMANNPVAAEEAMIAEAIRLSLLQAGH